MGNPNHDQRGRFASGSSSGASTGDHQAVSPSPTHRNVSGLNLSRKVVVTKHNGADSVGTASGGNGSGAGASPFRVALRPKKATTGLGRAAAERVALNESVDRRHYPNEGADVRQRFKSRATGMR